MNDSKTVTVLSAQLIRVEFFLHAKNVEEPDMYYAFDLPSVI